MLRLQNKYRNVLKKEPEKLEKIAEGLGLSEEERKKLLNAGRKPREKQPKDFLQRRLESEINALYDRLTQALKEENEKLREENEKLKTEKTAQ
jgi:restriction endonuclease Mrr